jgi:gliding motility-associated-like protein
MNFDKVYWEDGSQSGSKTFTSSTSSWIEVQDSGCILRDSFEVLINEYPSIEVGNDTVICEDQSFVINPVVSEGEIIWNSEFSGPTFEVATQGWVLAEIIKNGCSSIDSLFVTLRDCVYFDAFLPNAFSPNNDGNNDIFVPVFEEGIQVLNYKMSIFDRWGGIAFQTTDLQEGWDGRYETKIGGEGVYIYIIEITYQDDDGTDFATITGDILLIK